LIKKSKEGAENPLLPIDELERSIKQTGLFDQDVLDLTSDAEAEKMKAKVYPKIFDYPHAHITLPRFLFYKLDGCMNAIGLTTLPFTTCLIRLQSCKRGTSSF
jgi:hypothetical protein